MLQNQALRHFAHNPLTLLKPSVCNLAGFHFQRHIELDLAANHPGLGLWMRCDNRQCRFRLLQRPTQRHISRGSVKSVNRNVVNAALLGVEPDQACQISP